MSAPDEPAGVDPYAGDRATRYQSHHRKSLRTRCTSSRERAVVRRALRDAGSPGTVLDLPCGAGRFWPVFADARVRQVIAADVSEAMLQAADTNRLDERIPELLLRTSAFAIGLPDGSVDLVACLRFYHHLGRADDRARLLGELRRVTRGHVAVSLWVDGNLGALRRLGRSVGPAEPGYGRRTCRPRGEVEAEFRAAGFEIVSHYDVWPRIAMWRLYLLRRNA